MTNKLSKKIFSLSLFIFITLLIGGIAFRFYINNLTKDVVKLKQEAVVIKNNDIISLKLKLNQVSSQSIKINEYFIDSNNVAEFLDSLDVLGKQSGADFEIQSIVLEENKNKKEDQEGIGFNSLLLTTRISGSWENIINFILSIENIDKRVLIDALRISSVSNSETGELSWNLIMNLRGIAK